jgi:aryl-alcohol dehydrogenase-like predicted oxidoreductase
MCSAQAKATPAQIALAWLLAQTWIVPGTRKLERLDENPGAIAMEFTVHDRSEISKAASSLEVHGARGTGQERYI